MRAARTDKNHRAILGTFRALGWQVLSTHALGGFVDAVVLLPGYGVQLIEIKRDAKAKFTAKQQELIAAGWPLVRVSSDEDVMQLTRLARREQLQRVLGMEDR